MNINEMYYCLLLMLISQLYHAWSEQKNMHASPSLEMLWNYNHSEIITIYSEKCKGCQSNSIEEQNVRLGLACENLLTISSEFICALNVQPSS